MPKILGDKKKQKSVNQPIRTQTRTRISLLNNLLVGVSLVIFISTALGCLIGIAVYHAASLAGTVGGTTATPAGRLLAYYDFNETSGTTAIDSVGGYNGSMIYFGAADARRTADAPKGTSMQTDYRSYARLPNNFPNIPSNLSISLWFKPDRQPSQMNSNWPALMDRAGVFTIYALKGSNKLKTKIFTSDGAVFDGLNIVDFNFSTSTWHHLVWTFDGLSSKLYLDGSLATTTNLPAPKQLANQATPTPTSFFSISSPNSFEGKIDEVKIYSKVLSLTDVTKMYSSNNCGTTTDPLTVACSAACGQKNDANYSEKMSCLANSCKNRYPSNQEMINFCKNPGRVIFTIGELFSKLNTACMLSAGGQPTSTACLLALSYDLSQLEGRYKSMCESNYPPDSTSTLNMSELCYYAAQDASLISNDLLYCSDLSTKEKIDKCADYIALSTADSSAYLAKVSYICTYINTNCGQPYPDTASLSATAKSIIAKSAPTRSAAAPSGAKSGMSILDILSWLGNYVSDDELGPTLMDPCGPAFSNASVSAEKGKLGPGQHQICDATSHNCYGIALNGDRARQNNYGFLLSTKCKNYTWPEGLKKCPTIWGLIGPAFGLSCYCSHLSEAAAKDSSEGINPPPLPKLPDSCSLCYAPPLVKVTGTDRVTANLGIGQVEGTEGFVTDFVNLMNALGKTRGQCGLPDGCTLGDSFSPRGSAHSIGVAADICCSSSSTGQSLINSIKSSNGDSQLNIIREFTPNERVCNGTTGCPGGMIHLDKKTRQRSPCYFHDLTPDPAGYGDPPCKGWETCDPAF